MKTPIVVLVGGPNTGKTQFYEQYTCVLPNKYTIKCTPNLTRHTTPGMVLIDTPGVSEYRHKAVYSWDCIFKDADVILNFGNWSESEIYREKENQNPKMMTWSGDNAETMKRLTDYLQERI